MNRFGQAGRGGRLAAVLAGMLVWAAAAAPARAELTADQVVILAARRSPDSVKVARHYAAARGIPEDRILELDLPPGADLPRPEFDKLRLVIRNWLKLNKLTDQVRCIVTTYDMPLRVGQKIQGVGDADRDAELARRIDKAVDDVVKLTDELRKLVGKPPAGGARPAQPQAAQAFQTALNEAAAAVNKMSDGPDRDLAKRTMDRALVQFAGIAGAAGQMRNALSSPNASEQLKMEFAAVNGELRGLEFALRALQQAIKDSPERQAAIDQILIRANGVNGLAQTLHNQRESLSTKETNAAFESELSLLFWDEYPLYRWVMNPLHHRFDDPRLAAQKPKGRVLMTARLEAPTLELTLKLIDAAVEVEKTGLAGKFYIDARGLPAEPVGSGRYGEYDESLRMLAEFLKQKTSLEVVLDNRPELFAPNSCPDAALYSGWYSVGNYIDSFTWTKGSVAYHIASFEAVTLRDPKSKAWCKNMLERGVCATTGPVAEPYLASFPRPDEFFPLLLTGRYTLAECYFRTLNFNSWMNILVGDPLYRPFKAKPAVTVDDLPGKLAIPDNWGE
jgi:uncharacterized protein (TIGR03790 family)